MNTPVAAPEATKAIPSSQFALRQAASNVAHVLLDMVDAARAGNLTVESATKFADCWRNWTTALTLAEESERSQRVPAIGSRFNDGIYAGIIRGVNGAPDQHLVLMDGAVEEINWNDACAWAAERGAELPTRREQALLYANLPEQFEGRWYWSGEQHASDADCAWGQGFNDGFQSSDRKSNQFRARAVRRFAI